MNEMAFAQAIEKLEDVFTKVLFLRPEERLCAPTSQHLTDIKEALNNVFENRLFCTDVIYTLNTDKEYFGIMINPAINAIDALKIFSTNDPVYFKNYQIEFDSKIFDAGLSSEQITAITLYEISSMLSSNAVDEIRSLIDLYILAEEDVIRIRESANYSQLLIYALKDTLYKVSSLMYKEDEEDLLSSKIVSDANLNDSLISAQEKLVSNVYGISDTVRSPKTIILKWMFMIYKDMKTNSRLAKETLEEASLFTASLLVKQEINKTLSSIERINAQTILETSDTITKFIEKKAMYSLNEAGLFKSLKQSGLRKIEDELYELSVRAKAAETEDDVLYVLRSINTRLSILEDYIYNSNISDAEKKKWTAVAEAYRALREELAKSKVLKKKSYGLFFDYSQLDSLDD